MKIHIIDVLVTQDFDNKQPKADLHQKFQDSIETAKDVPWAEYRYVMCMGKDHCVICNLPLVAAMVPIELPTPNA